MPNHLPGTLVAVVLLMTNVLVLPAMCSQRAGPPPAVASPGTPMQSLLARLKDLAKEQVAPWKGLITSAVDVGVDVLSGNEPEVLSGNKVTVLSGNRLSVLSGIRIEVNVAASGGQSSRHDAESGPGTPHADTLGPLYGLREEVARLRRDLDAIRREIHERPGPRRGP